VGYHEYGLEGTLAANMATSLFGRKVAASKSGSGSFGGGGGATFAADNDCRGFFGRLINMRHG